MSKSKMIVTDDLMHQYNDAKLVCNDDDVVFLLHPTNRLPLSVIILLADCFTHHHHCKLT